MNRDSSLRVVPPAAAAGRVVAAVDVGSNSIKLLVARTRDDGEVDVLLREKTMARLGHETLQTGRLSEAALEAGTVCLARYAALARAMGAERILCAATCAVREAENAAEFARRAKAAADVEVEIISGEEEARLTMRAVRGEFPASADPLLVIDIGGGSTEIVVASGRKIPLAESLDLGAVRLADRFGRADRLDTLAAKALREEVDRRLKRLAPDVKASGFRTVVGTSGTIAALADLAASASGSETAGAHRTLTRRGLKAVATRLLDTTLRERARMPGLDPRRADIITPGALLLLALFERLGVKELVVCDRSLRDGMILDWMDRSGAATDAGEPDVRRASVARLGRRWQLEWPHAAFVRDTALLLFDRTHALHQLASREREWLEHAAFLHDVGTAVALRRHHKHSAYLIEHGGLRGFAPSEVAAIAQVARYHRKARPKAGHAGFASLDPWVKPVVEKLAAILRLADALDRSRRQVVTSLDVAVTRRKLVLKVAASGPAEVETWALRKKSDLFARVFGRRVEAFVDAAASPAAASPAASPAA